MGIIVKYFLRVSGLILLLNISCSPPKSSENNQFNIEPLIRWNEIIMETAESEDGLLTLKGVRAEALAFTAVHDALNAIEPRFSVYSYIEKWPNADAAAASNQALYQIAISQFPQKQDTFKIMLDQALSSIPDGNAKNQGIELGKNVAEQILSTRVDDQWNQEADYVWHPMAPGVYAEFNQHSGTPEGFVFGAGWAVAKPFMLRSQDQFRSPPPPEITSEAYTEAYNEVKEYGRSDSGLRTQDQAHLAMWWKDFVENSHNRLVRQLVTKENLNMWQAARLFALLNMTIYDAYVNVFDNKFHYNHWRPYTAIRWADKDGNSNTEADTSWNNLHRHTYAFPSYPSAHGCASAAATTVLANTLGTGDEYRFTMTTELVDKAGPFSGKLRMEPPTRTFQSFSEAGMEAAMSRVYLGIHFRYDSEEGYLLGKQIGEYAVGNYLIPLPKKF